MRKKYHLKKSIKLTLLIIVVLICEFFYLEHYLDRIEKIENGVNINESEK